VNDNNKRQFLNFYQKKDGDTSLQQLAQNTSIVEWVNSVVAFHKKKTLEKTLLDLCLQCIYCVLFPETSVPLAVPLDELLKLATPDIAPKAPSIIGQLKQGLTGELAIFKI
jgi:hypothetical protein